MSAACDVEASARWRYPLKRFMKNEDKYFYVIMQFSDLIKTFPNFCLTFLLSLLSFLHYDFDISYIYINLNILFQVTYITFFNSRVVGGFFTRIINKFFMDKNGYIKVILCFIYLLK